MPLQRYKLTVAYRGTRYHGWQHQSVNTLTWKGPMPPEGQGIPTIQEVLSRTIQSVVGHTINLVGSSRTDAGVHALAFVPLTAGAACDGAAPIARARLAAAAKAVIVFQR